MSEEAIWYYSNAAKQPNGPMPLSQLRDALHAPGWYERALIWRDGWPQWRPWKEVAAELGLPIPLAAEVTAPPPSPQAPPSRPSAQAPSPVSRSAPTEIQPPPPARAPAPRPQPARAAAPSRTGPVPEDEMVYAGFWRRVVALFADSIIVSIITTPVIGILSAIALPMVIGTDPTQASPTKMFIVFGLIYGLSFAMIAGYFVLLERSASGATLGKRLLGIRVVDKNGERITFLRSVGRFFARALSSLPGNLGYLLAAFTGRKQALHDFVAGTLVIDKAYRSDLGEKSGSVSIGIVMAILAVVMLVGIIPIAIMAAIAIPAYHDYTIRAKISGAVNDMSPLKMEIAEYFISNDSQCPGNGDGAIQSADSYFGLYHSRAEVQPGQDGNGTPFCLINITMANTGQATIDGNVVQLAMDTNMNWTCASDTVPVKYLPSSCKQQ